MERLSDYNVLYLEDDPDSVELVKFTLEAAGMRVTAVDSIDEVLSLASAEEFDLFLLDALLPTGSSFRICPRLRLIAPSVPIVFYTALGFPDDVQKGTDAGADAYIVKPFMGDLAETLKEIILEKSRNPCAELAPGKAGPYRAAAF